MCQEQELLRIKREKRINILQSVAFPARHGPASGLLPWQTYIVVSNNIKWDSTFQQQLTASKDGEEAGVVMEDMLASLVPNL